ncbi:MAG: hypothetical protein U1E27_09565, partial [Kiritimatiellia bacterium]|nr:hypothetical protein [Kiritimatiellia bacterium]
LPPNLATARLDPDRVQVDVTVLEHASTQSLEGIVVTLLTSPGKSPPVLLEPTQVTVVLQGRAETLRALEASRVRAFVDCIGLTDEDEIDLPILVHALPGVRAISISPSFARIRIRKPELRKDEL